MPALPPHPGVLEVLVQWLLGSDADVSTKTHYEYSGTAPSNATCVALAHSIHTLAVTNLIPLCSGAVSLTGVKVTDLTTSSSGVGDYPTTVVGTRGGPPYLAAETAALWNQGISRRYRGGKPRCYWPFGVPSDLTSPQAWLAASITDFEVGLNAWFGGVEALSSSGTVLGALCAISNYEGFTSVTNPITGRTRDVPKVRAVAIPPDQIATVAINPKPGSQRRRQQHSP